MSFLAGIGMLVLLVVFVLSATVIVYAKWVEKERVRTRVERLDGPCKGKRCGLPRK